MANGSEKRPHIQLRLTTKGKAETLGGGGKTKNNQTRVNLSDKHGHASKLRILASSVVSNWQSDYKKRDEEKKPLLPEVIPLILQIDPGSFDLDQLRVFEIEVISELEDGYIIGASTDTDLSELQKKISLFVDGKHGGGTVPQIWSLLNERHQRPEFILSPKLLEEWDQLKDKQIYVVDVGISCLGPRAQLHDYPKRKVYRTEATYSDAVIRWMNKRSVTYSEWDDFAAARQQELIKFVEHYKGNFLSSFIDGVTPRFAKSPDCFSCRIEISGQGLKDLVLTFPYVFEVTEKDNFSVVFQPSSVDETEDISFEPRVPASTAPKVCVIDSGIVERHPLLEKAIDSANSTSWVPLEKDLTADRVSNGGHGTRVAGAVLYPRTVPRSGKESAVCWLQNARVLDQHCRLSEKLYPPELLEDIVQVYYSRTKTRIFNHSIAGDVPCRTRYMSAWAEAIDRLTYENDILFIVAAGNIPLVGNTVSTRLSVSDHFSAGRSYPDYLSEKSCRIANPAQSLQALTVGSVTLNSYSQGSWSSVGEKDHPSAFSCSGPGIWGTIKPDVVEYGGDLVKDEGDLPNIKCRTGIGPEFVRSTLGNAPTPLISADTYGTSYAAPKVSHIAACLAAELPTASCLLYRALIVQSARWPEWTIAKSDEDKLKVIHQIGYGIPNLDLALRNTPNRITLITREDERIGAQEAHIYQVKLPENLRSPGEEHRILVEVTLSYKAQPRRTRRNRRKYLSTWLDWECSKQGEDPDYFLGRVLDDYNASKDAEKGEELFAWTLGKEKRYKTIKNISRSVGTLQKDWAIVESHKLREAFCIAVVGHKGWNNDPSAEVPYSLVVSFEAVEADIQIYAALAQAQVTTEVENQIEIQVSSMPPNLALEAE